MIKRDATNTLRRLSKGFPILSITGPRQSGKTTLARHVFSNKPYLSLENPDIRTIAEEDPRGLLSQFPEGAVFDEVQRVPQILSYIQGIVDEKMRPGMFILTGSQQFGLLSGITQSLAGRVGIVQLLPFTIGELDSAKKLSPNLEEVMLQGFYPPLYDRDITVGDWFSGYVTTYIERDVRQLINVRDLSIFQRFLRMCAARVGQLLNLSSIASDCAISNNTAASWISVLEASYILFLLRPHYHNFNKRLIKSPKLYFYDTGLAAWLLGIRDKGQMAFHAHRGALFENLVASELIKARFNRGLQGNIYFWRDSSGLEIDILIDKGDILIPIEIKSGQTIAKDFFINIDKWTTISDTSKERAILIYGGNRKFIKDNVTVLPWRSLQEIENP